MILRRNSKQRKLKKTARRAAEAAKAAPPRRSIALVLAAVGGLVAAVIAKRFLGGDAQSEPSTPDVEGAGVTWAPQPVPQETEREASQT